MARSVRRMAGDRMMRAFLGSKGIRLSSGWDLRALPARGDKPFNIKPQFAQGLSNGNILVCEGQDVIEVTPDLDIVWQFGQWGVDGSDDRHLNKASTAWLYEKTGTVIVADAGNNRVVEVDRIAGRITRTIDPLPGPVSAFLNPDSGFVIVAEREASHVCEVNWNGQVVWDFGVRKEAGSDDSHLNNPWLAHPAKCDWGSPFDGALISDYGNNRVILVRKTDGRIVRRTLSNGPEMAFQTQNLGAAVTGQIVGFVTDQDWNLRWYSPNNWRIVPTPTGSFILMDAVNLYEVVPDLCSPPRILPGLYRLLTKYQLPADSSVGPIEAEADFPQFPSIPAFAFRQGFTAYVKSSDSAKLGILTAKTEWSWAPTLRFDGWETYQDGIALLPGKPFRLRIDDNHLFLSLKVTMGARNGVLDAWVVWT